VLEASTSVLNRPRVVLNSQRRPLGLEPFWKFYRPLNDIENLLKSARGLTSILNPPRVVLNCQRPLGPLSIRQRPLSAIDNLLKSARGLYKYFNLSKNCFKLSDVSKTLWKCQNSLNNTANLLEIAKGTTVLNPQKLLVPIKKVPVASNCLQTIDYKILIKLSDKVVYDELSNSNTCHQLVFQPCQKH